MPQETQNLEPSCLGLPHAGQGNGGEAGGIEADPIGSLSITVASTIVNASASLPESTALADREYEGWTVLDNDCLRGCGFIARTLTLGSGRGGLPLINRLDHRFGVFVLLRTHEDLLDQSSCISFVVSEN